jgi:predicted nucleic acid-binding protein
MPPWVSIEPLARPVSALGGSALDAGEAAVIQLALERQVGTVAIDEVRGRRAALAAGLRVTGSLGLLGRAKAIGLIPVVKPYVTAMRSAGIFLDDGLVEWFLKETGETT